MLKKRLKFLLSPWSIILGMIIGIIVGLYFKGIVKYLVPFGHFYISILKMTILPIIISAVLVSISKLLRSKETSRYLNKIIFIFIISLILTAMVSVLVSIIFMPVIGNNTEMKKSIGKMMIAKDETNSSAAGASKSVIKIIDSRFNEKKEEKKQSIAEFLLGLIPNNIFEALSEGKTLKVIFFFIVLGIMMKFVSNNSSEVIINFFDGIFEAFQELIKILLYLLPFGLCALLAEQFSQIGFAMLASLAKLIILIYIVSFIIFLVSTLFVWKYSKQPYFKQFRALKDAIMIAIGTRSSFATLPLALTGMIEGLNFDKDRTNLTISLGFTLCKYGKILIFCIGAVFAAYLYDYHIGFQSGIIIIITSVLAGMAASGAPSIISRSMISIVLIPLGIPSEAIIVILLTIDPVVDPIITLISTYPNYAATAMIAGDEQ